MAEQVGVIPTMILDGEALRPTEYQVGSLAEAVIYEPRGVYTVARTFHGDHALLLDAHLDRLEESARLSNIPLRLDRTRCGPPSAHCCARRASPRAASASPFRRTIRRCCTAAEPLQQLDPALLSEGAAVITVPIRRENPAVKTTEWLATRRSAHSTLPEGIYEAIMQDERGCLLEGLSSNFYGVLDGTLHTAGDGVLAGITRRAVFEVAPQILPLSLEPVCREDMPALTEAMLTSSTRGVVPITRTTGRRWVMGAWGRSCRAARALRRLGRGAPGADLEPILAGPQVGQHLALDLPERHVLQAPPQGLAGAGSRPRTPLPTPGRSVHSGLHPGSSPSAG